MKTVIPQHGLIGLFLHCCCWDDSGSQVWDFKEMPAECKITSLMPNTCLDIFLKSTYEQFYYTSQGKNASSCCSVTQCIWLQSSHPWKDKSPDWNHSKMDFRQRQVAEYQQLRVGIICVCACSTNYIIGIHISTWKWVGFKQNVGLASPRSCLNSPNIMNVNFWTVLHSELE